MKTSVVGATLALFGLVLTGCATPLKQTFPESARIVPEGRHMIVSVPQSEINPAINQSVMGAAGFGLIGALVDTGVNQSRTKTAEAAIIPVRDALTDYKFDQKALSTSDELSLSVDWLTVKKTEVNKDVSNARFSSALDASASQQLVSITYDYVLGPEFRTLTVGSNVAVLSKKLPANGKKEDRALLKNADFSRMFTCIVPLPAATDEIDENASKWSANGGALTEQSLDKALAKLAVMMKKGFELTPQQEQALKSAKNAKVGTYLGKVIQRDEEGTLLLTPFGQFQYIYGSFPL